MHLTLYHGSERVVPSPSLSEGRIHNDFGRGFYCTCDRERAMEWACSGGRNGFLNEYRLQADGLRILDLTDDTHDTWDWISLCVSNKIFDKSPESIAEESIGCILSEHPMDISEKDVIIGHRADCSYHSMLQAFLDNSMTLVTLERMLVSDDSETQIVLVSEKAFDNLSFMGFEPVDRKTYHGRWRGHDLEVRRSMVGELRDTEPSGYIASIKRCDP